VGRVLDYSDGRSFLILYMDVCKICHWLFGNRECLGCFLLTWSQPANDMRCEWKLDFRLGFIRLRLVINQSEYTTQSTGAKVVSYQLRWDAWAPGWAPNKRGMCCLVGSKAAERVFPIGLFPSSHDRLMPYFFVGTQIVADGGRPSQTRRSWCKTELSAKRNWMQLRFVLFWRLSTRIEAIRYPLGVKKKKLQDDGTELDLWNWWGEREEFADYDLLFSDELTQQVESQLKRVVVRTSTPVCTNL
jgi:hypothetical protein